MIGGIDRGICVDSLAGDLGSFRRDIYSVDQIHRLLFIRACQYSEDRLLELETEYTDPLCPLASS